MDTKKYIAPGGWFSLEYPATWSEFEDEEGSFLFYNPSKWSGNFRISAYKDQSPVFGKDSISYELSHNKQSSRCLIGGRECAYSTEDFEEEGVEYTSYFWVTGEGNTSVECSFTVKKGMKKDQAESIIASLEIRSDKKHYPKEYIPVRVLEINEINSQYEWLVTQVKKIFKKDFTSSKKDIDLLQELIDRKAFKPSQQEAWQAVGIAFGTIVVNEMDGMDWITVIDEPYEYPALRLGQTDLVVDVTNLPGDTCWKEGQGNLKRAFEWIKTEVEKRL